MRILSAKVQPTLVGGQEAGKSTFFPLLAVKDEWPSDDLQKLDDDNVYRKLQGHWIIEMAEMIATANGAGPPEGFLPVPEQMELLLGFTKSLDVKPHRKAAVCLQLETGKDGQNAARQTG